MTRYSLCLALQHPAVQGRGHEPIRALWDQSQRLGFGLVTVELLFFHLARKQEGIRIEIEAQSTRAGAVAKDSSGQARVFQHLFELRSAQTQAVAH